MARILVVDDVKFISKMLTAIFEEKGHQVIVATDGISAEETARREHPDLILMDVMMPGLDGIEVTRRLKGDTKTGGVPIVIVSAKNDPQSIAAAYAAGADHYMVKPFNTEELLERVATLVGASRMNFSCELVHDVPVITVLLEEIDDPVGGQLQAALVKAHEESRRPVVLDLTRVKKLGPAVAEIAEQCHAQLAEHGAGLYVVLPGKGIGVKSLSSRLGLVLRVHEALDGAVTEAQLQAPETAAEPPAASSPPPPRPAAQRPAPTATIRDSRRGVTLETREDAARLLVQRQTLGDEFFEFVTEIVPDLTVDLHVDLREVEEVSSVDVWEFSALADKLARKQHKLLLLSPEPSVSEFLHRGGLGEIVVADSDLAMQAPSAAAPPTKASS
jgi:CheY-like chemotaxis protein